MEEEAKKCNEEITATLKKYGFTFDIEARINLQPTKPSIGNTGVESPFIV